MADARPCTCPPMYDCPRHKLQEAPVGGRGRSARQAVNDARTPVKRTRPKEVPDARRGFWHGVMCTKLRLQEREPGFDGFYRCRCGEPGCSAAIEGFEEAREFFVPGHVKPRSSYRTKGFRFGNLVSLGPDDPNNIEPVTPDCNAAEFWKRNVS